MNPMAAPVMGAPNMAPTMSMQSITQDEVQRIYQRWVQMKTQGDTNSPEFHRLAGQLKMIQQKQTQLQQRQQMHALQQQQQHAQQQQQQQHQQQQQQHAHQQQQAHQQAQQVQAQQQHQRNQSIGNGAMAQVNGRIPSQPQQQLQSASPSRPSGDIQMHSRSGSSASFTSDQLTILHNQIVAFKHISKGLVPPLQVLQTIAPHAASKTAAAIAAIASANATMEAMKVEAEGNKPTQSGFESFSSPWKHLQPIIPFLEHGLREKRVIVPSILPTGIDLDKVAEERERVIHSRIMQRKAELEDMTSNLAQHDLNADPGNLDHRLKIKALIELKSLNLLQKQRSLRLEYLKDAQHGENLAFNANRSAFRRMKKQSIREARITEKLEKQQREAKSMREKEKHKEHIDIILQRGMQLKEECAEKRNRASRFTQRVLGIHQHIEKEEQKRIERTAKQRLQALKANDEEAYMKLLDEAKDTRITHLLRQTDSFLDSLAASVREQQKNAIQNYGIQEGQDDEMEEEDGEDGKPKIDYYSVAHRIKETITEQPNILVGGKLKDYQIKGLQWMVSLYNNNLNGILADEMGLGKTIQTISLITHLIEKKKQMGPYLVIVPLSTLTNWKSEFEKWAPSVSMVVYKGTPAQRKVHQAQIKYGQFQVLLTTYEFIIKDRPLLSKLKWIYMIIDEGHRMKNTQSKLSFTLTTYYNCRYRLILTGTPLQNNLPELWALLNFALPTIFKSVKSFDEWFNTPFANAGTQDKIELTEEESLLIIRRLHKVLRPFLLRRLKKDVESELPDKKEEVIKCKFSSLQAKLYQQMVNGGMLYVQDNDKGGKVNIKGLSNMIMQLRKICNHPFVFEEIESAINPSKVNNDTLWRTAGKFELLDRLLPKFFVTKHRVLMFFQMTQIMNIMEDFLHLRGYKYLRLDGSTKADDRSALLKLFNAPDSEFFIFLLSTRAGGLGLNLQTADTVIIYDSDWNPHQDLQAQDRAHRIGQKNEVRILRLITSNSVEEKILERAQYKLDIDGKVIQAGKFDNKSTNEERDALLRTLLEAEKDITSENEEMDDDELNEVCARTDAELVLFRKMDEERNKDKLYGTNGELPRLYSEAELPDLYINEQPIVEEVKLPEGRGARERAAIRYDDGLSEEQWLDAIDNDEDVEEIIRQKREKEERRAEKKGRKNARESTPPQLPESSPIPETPVVGRKKRGRKAASEKRAAATKELPDEPKRKKARGKGVDSMAPGDRAIHQRVFESVYEACKNLEDKDSEIQGRLHSEHFIVLPSKKLYPDYYQFISSPISFEIIKKRIDKQQYGSIAEFKSDMLLMFANAKQYNEPGSLVYADAESMEEEFNDRLKEEVEKHGLSYDVPASNGDNSAAISTVSTPMTGTPVIKLKLGKKSTLGNGTGTATATGTATSLDSRANSTPDLDNDRSEGELSE